MSNNALVLPSGFLRAPAGLGVGRYVCQLQRVTLKFCKSFGNSRGMRDFIEHNLVDFAKENPGIVVYVKPRRHRSPVICAEYLSGETQWIPVGNETRDDIMKWMELLRTQYRDGGKLRIRKLWNTNFPSIQGPWTPITFREPAENLVEFPDKKLSAVKQTEATATEKLIEMFKLQQLSEKTEKDKENVRS